jgi:NarL family two-component system response regulator LiaR
MSAVASQGNPRDKIKVLLADDHPAFREGLGRLLEEESDIQIVAAVADGQEAATVAAELSPDVAIIDIAMPNLNGIEAIKKIRAGSSKTAVIVLSAYDYESYVLPAIEAGAAAYLLKTVGVREVAGAVRAVHAGQTVLDPTASHKVLSHLAYATGKTPSERTLQRLHPRELEVLRLGARGLSNKEIASSLVISERTVQTHFRNILRKLKVGSRTEAVLHALREGWITLDDLP